MNISDHIGVISHGARSPRARRRRSVHDPQVIKAYLGEDEEEDVRRAAA